MGQENWTDDIRNRLELERRADLAALTAREEAIEALVSTGTAGRDRDMESRIVDEWLARRDRRRARLGEPRFLAWCLRWDFNANGKFCIQEMFEYFACAYRTNSGGWKVITNDYETGAEHRQGPFCTVLEAQRRAFDLLILRESFRRAA